MLGHFRSLFVISYFYQDTLPWMKCCTIEKDEEAVDEACEDHNQRQEPAEETEQVERILLLLEYSDCMLDCAVPFIHFHT